MIDCALADDLLRSQDALQTEAEHVLVDLDLINVRSRAGAATRVGSSVTGLMVQRDIDIWVVCADWHADATFAAVRPLAAHPRVRQLRYDNQTGACTPGFPTDRYDWEVSSCADAGAVWKIAIWFWPPSGLSGAIEHTAEIRRRRTRAPRVAILSLKRYTAVRTHDVRTPTACVGYRAARPNHAPQGSPPSRGCQNGYDASLR